MSKKRTKRKTKKTNNNPKKKIFNAKKNIHENPKQELEYLLKKFDKKDYSGLDFVQGIALEHYKQKNFNDMIATISMAYNWNYS